MLDKLNRIGITDDPEIIAVAADEASKYVAGEGWYTDATFEEAPPMGSMLYMTRVPGDGSGAEASLDFVYLAPVIGKGTTVPDSNELEGAT